LARFCILSFVWSKFIH